MFKNLLIMSIIILPFNSVMAERFAESSRTEFLNSCNTECSKGAADAKMHEFCSMHCNCSLEGLEAKYTENEILEGFSGRGPNAAKFEENVTALFTSCAEEAIKKYGL